MSTNKETIIIIGGGAAGFFCAINCAENFPQHHIIILEKSNKVLSKVRVSGGGRCNVTHALFNNSLLIKNYPRGERELMSVFSRFTTTDTIDWFKKREVEIVSEPDGRMFPSSNTSETIIQCFQEEVKKRNIDVLLQKEVKKIEKTDNGFALHLADSKIIPCNKLVIAAGGHPNSSSYNWIKDTGHSIVPPVPSLFTFNMPGNPVIQLPGVAVKQAKVKIAGTKLVSEGPLLITHWGMSGPAVLRLSAWGARSLNEKNYDFTAIIQWVQNETEESLRSRLDEIKKNHGGKKVSTISFFDLPSRLWDFLLHKSDINPESRWGDLNKQQLNKLIRNLLFDEYPVKGKTTFKEEFVTCGGINLKEVDFKTMQSKKWNGLYFTGEVLDIDAITGGFNFQAAWSTAYIAAQLQ